MIWLLSDCYRILSQVPNQFYTLHAALPLLPVHLLVLNAAELQHCQLCVFNPVVWQGV